MTEFTGHQLSTSTVDDRQSLNAHRAHPIVIVGGWRPEDITFVKGALTVIAAALVVIALILGFRDNNARAIDTHNASLSGVSSETAQPTAPVDRTLYNSVLRSGMLDKFADGALKPRYPLIESDAVSYAWQNGRWVDVFVNTDPSTSWEQYNMLYQRAAALQPLDLTKAGSYLRTNLPGVSWAFWSTTPPAYGENLTTGILTILTDQDILLSVKVHTANLSLDQVRSMVEGVLASSKWSSVTN